VHPPPPPPSPPPGLALRRRADGAALLQWAAEEGLVDVVKALLAAGAEVNAFNRSGRTALMAACEAGHVDVVAALLAAHPRLEMREERYGWSALHCAAYRGAGAVVQAFLDAGCPSSVLHLRSAAGHTAAEVARLQGWTHVADLLSGTFAMSSRRSGGQEEAGSVFTYVKPAAAPAPAPGGGRTAAAGAGDGGGDRDDWRRSAAAGLWEVAIEQLTASIAAVRPAAIGHAPGGKRHDDPAASGPADLYMARGACLRALRQWEAAAEDASAALRILMVDARIVQALAMRAACDVDAAGYDGEDGSDAGAALTHRQRECMRRALADAALALDLLSQHAAGRGGDASAAASSGEPVAAAIAALAQRMALSKLHRAAAGALDSDEGGDSGGGGGGGGSWRGGEGGGDLYEQLLVPRDADSGTIARAYRTLSVAWHPDKYASWAQPRHLKRVTARFRAVCEAARILTDPTRRALYTASGDAAAADALAEALSPTRRRHSSTSSGEGGGGEAGV
jgi:DnaJ-domain-containing protein 1